jgi:hypothetical protein
MVKFTSAPWIIKRIGASKINAVKVIAKKDHSVIATIRDAYHGSEDYANAQIIALAPAMFGAIFFLLNARKESSEAFRRMSYTPEVQAVFDAVEEASK